MSDQIVIGVKDNQTANALQAELGALGIQVNRKSGNQMVSFGSNKIPGPSKFSTILEVLLILKEIPGAMDAISKIFGKFQHGIELCINGTPTKISDWQESLKNPHWS